LIVSEEMEEGDPFNLFLSVSPLNPGDKKELWKAQQEKEEERHGTGMRWEKLEFDKFIRQPYRQRYIKKHHHGIKQCVTQD